MTREELEELGALMSNMSNAASDMIGSLNRTPEEEHIYSIWESTTRAGFHIQALIIYPRPIDPEIIQEWHNVISSAEEVIINPATIPFIYDRMMFGLNDIMYYLRNPSYSYSSNLNQTTNTFEITDRELDLTIGSSSLGQEF